MDLGRELLKGNTPTLVLAILSDGPLHGYGIARELERRSDSALKFKDGTLYPTLHSLEADGLIESQWENPDKGQARKIYVITTVGQGNFKTAHTAMAQFCERGGNRNRRCF